jgi:predicted naringenin-chalcone synthase
VTAICDAFATKIDLNILGLGTALPPHRMSQVEAAELAQQVVCRTAEDKRLVQVLYRRSGVQQRFTVLPYRIALDWVANEQPESEIDLSTGGDDGILPEGVALDTAVEQSFGPTTAERMQFYREYSVPLALQASKAALENSGTSAAEITHLITVSCTGFVAPGVDVALITQLGLRPTVQRVNVGFMGCHGAINGLRVATAMAAADPKMRLLLCAVELCSLHYRFNWDPAKNLGNVLFADGAAALVGAPTSAASPSVQGDEAWRVAATGSCLIPDSQDSMTWDVGDHGFEMQLSSRVPDLICEHLRPWLTSWLAEQNLSLDDVKSWAIHPGGPRILSAVEESLGLPREATGVSREVLSECGNMSSPTVLFILDRMRQRRAERPCVALGFGPGLIAEAALLV